MNVNYFINPYQSLQAQTSPAPPLTSQIQIPFKKSVKYTKSFQILQTPVTYLAFTRQKLLKINKLTKTSKELISRSDIIRNVQIVDEYIGVTFFRKDRGDFYIIFDSNFVEIRSFYCTKGQITAVARFENLVVLELALQLANQVQIVDLTISTQISSKSRYLHPKTVYRYFQAQNHFLLIDENLFKIGQNELITIKQDPRNFFITSYYAKTGPSLSWRCFTTSKNLILLANEVAAELFDGTRRANFLHLLPNGVQDVKILQLENEIITFFISKYEVNYVKLDREFKLIERVNQIQFGLFEGEKIMNFDVFCGQIEVVTEFGRCNFDGIECVFQRFGRVNRSVKVNKKRNLKVEFAFKGVGDASSGGERVSKAGMFDFLLE